MAKRLDASSVISDPSFIEGTQPHKFGMEPNGFSESASTLGHDLPANMHNGPYNNRVEHNPYYRQRDLDSIASNDQSEEHSVYTDDGSRSEYTEETMERNSYHNLPPPGVPRVGHHDDMYDSRPRYGPPNGNSYRYPGGYNNPKVYEDRLIGQGNRRNSRSQSPSYNRRSIRSQSPSMSRNSRVATPRQKRNVNDHRDTNDVVDEIISERNRSADVKRTIKLVAVPAIIVVVIAISIGIVFATRSGGNGRNASETQDQELIQILLPTSSPTFQGEYHCPSGFTGPVPTKGCLGYVQCNGMGGIEGGVLDCPSGTLYDANLKTCSWEASVDCSTKAPGNKNTDSNVDDIGVASNPATSPPTFKPTASHDTAKSNTIKVGPTNTFNHRLSFQGVLTLGDVATFETNMENYIRIFFSPSRAELLGDDAAALAEDDTILNNLTDVKVDLTIKKFEWSGMTRLRRLQDNVELIVVYDQKTEYMTSDPSIKVGTVVRYPYEDQYEQFLIDYLKTTDDVFGSLTSVDFLEPGQITAVSSIETKSPSLSPVSETLAPTIVIVTSSPSPAPTNEPSSSSTELSFVAFPEYGKVRGFMWIDTNKNGLFETTEPSATGTFANLRQCEDDKWMQTTSTNGNGQYQFLGVEEGEYYVEFFRPSEECETLVICFFGCHLMKLI